MEISMKHYDRFLDGREHITIMMPLKRNVPRPRHEWVAAVCPACNRECWYNPAGDNFLQDAVEKTRIRFRCTECALLESVNYKLL